MPLLIADKFEDSLQRLSGEEQKAAKLTVYELQTNPAGPGLNYEAVKGAKDKRFRSVRVNLDVRMIVHELGDSITVCFVGHHDDAYDWAARRRLEAHPKTGAAQLVQIRETVREIEVPTFVPAPTSDQSASSSDAPEEPLFAHATDAELLSYGVPEDWLEDVRHVASDAALEALGEHLPAEATEALWEIATGGNPTIPERTPDTEDPFAHPDAQRRFLLVNTEEELRRALDYPWERWMIFLHPAQRGVAERRTNGPARVAGSAGTGKTVVALHRAVHLAKAHPEQSILLTTFNDTLAASLSEKLGLLAVGEPDLTARVHVETLDQVALRLHREAIGEPKLAGSVLINSLADEAVQAEGNAGLSIPFIQSEWADVVDEWQLGTWPEYREVKRLGRKSGLGRSQREQLWPVFTHMRRRLAEDDSKTMAQVYAAVTAAIRDGHVVAYDMAIVDEAQDISVPQLRLLAAMAGERPDGLFFAGDLGQRIFQTPFSWASLGVNVRGRSTTLRVNYRTSHEIRRYADRLLPPQLSDVDGNSDSRRGTVSVFTGTEPSIVLAASEGSEREHVARWLHDLAGLGAQADEVAVFVRSEQELERAEQAVRAAGREPILISNRQQDRAGRTPVGTMEQAKGLEYRAVVVMACDEDVIPSQQRIDEMGDYADLEDTWETERQLLYVACTRARDHLLVTGLSPGSEFVEDLMGA